MKAFILFFLLSCNSFVFCMDQRDEVLMRRMVEALDKRFEQFDCIDKNMEESCKTYSLSLHRNWYYIREFLVNRRLFDIKPKELEEVIPQLEEERRCLVNTTKKLAEVVQNELAGEHCLESDKKIAQIADEELFFKTKLLLLEHPRGKFESLIVKIIEFVEWTGMPIPSRKNFENSEKFTTILQRYYQKPTNLFDRFIKDCHNEYHIGKTKENEL